MYFLIDNKLKIIFGWTPKCGCSHIKKMFGYLRTDNINSKIHIPSENGHLPNNMDNYTTILIIRNPYEKVISGFLDKYNPNGSFRHKWTNNNLVFSKFVDELVIKNWNLIDKHHFLPQVAEHFNKSNILKSKYLKIYDIKNIDYSYIEKLYNKKIPEFVLNYKGGHERNATNILEEYVYDLDINLYYKNNVPLKYFYNEDIKNKVSNFYKDDILFLKESGFDYVEETIF